MDQERTVKKALFWMRQEGIILPENIERVKHYCELIFNAGFDYKNKVNNSERFVNVYKNDRRVLTDNITNVARIIGVERHVISTSIRKNRVCKKGYRFEYINNESTGGGDDREG